MNAATRTLSADATRLLAFTVLKAIAVDCAVAAQALGLSRETTHRHASDLAEAGLVKTRCQGSEICSLRVTAIGKRLLLATPLGRKIVVPAA